MRIRAFRGRSTAVEPVTQQRVRWYGWAVASAAVFALWVSGCMPVVPPGDQTSVLVPEDYRATFMQVRGCRNSTGHPSMVRVWLNSVGAAAYLAEDNPMPVGSIVVKEEFAGTDCSDDADLTLWSVMRKEPAGFDAMGHDWHFQQVNAPDRTIFRDGNTTCIACHTAPACLERDLMCTEP